MRHCNILVLYKTWSYVTFAWPCQCDLYHHHEPHYWRQGKGHLIDPMIGNDWPAGWTDVIIMATIVRTHKWSPDVPTDWLAISKSWFLLPAPLFCFWTLIVIILHFDIDGRLFLTEAKIWKKLRWPLQSSHKNFLVHENMEDKAQ